MAQESALPAAARDLLAAYLRALAAERNLSPFTLRNYESDLTHLATALDGRGVSLPAMSRSHFRAYLASMIEVGVAQGSIVRRVSTAR